MAFHLPRKFHKTKNNNYRLNMDLAFDKGLEFDEILGKDKQVKFN